MRCTIFGMHIKSMLPTPKDYRANPNLLDNVVNFRGFLEPVCTECMTCKHTNTYANIHNRLLYNNGWYGSPDTTVSRIPYKDLSDFVERSMFQRIGTPEECLTCRDLLVNHYRGLGTCVPPHLLIIDTNAHIAHGGVRIQPVPRETVFDVGNYRYQLVSVILQTVTHFVCNVLLHGDWFHYDDQTPQLVSITDPWGLPRRSTAKPRFLYYVKICDSAVFYPPCAIVSGPCRYNNRQVVLIHD